MVYHVLNGDCLAETFTDTNLAGEVVVCRECLIDGPVSSQGLMHFWEERATYLADSFHANRVDYFRKVAEEFEKLTQLPSAAEVCLWFEDDLFCQVNLWFIFSLLVAQKKAQKVYRVFPICYHDEDRWRGFALSDAQRLEQAYDKRVLVKEEDMNLGANLWFAYQQQDMPTLLKLSKSTSACFRSLEEVCQAQADRIGVYGQPARPERIIQEIIATGITHFPAVFSEFSKRAGMYGFGDVQVKWMYDKIIQGKSK